MPKLAIGNWKMNPDNLEGAIDLAKDEDVAGAIICPPFLYLEEISGILSKAKLGAQDVAPSSKRAQTGEISIEQLKDLQVGYVIVGHSERRALGETDEVINQKIQAVLEEGIVPILCVGEDLDTHERGDRAVIEFVSSQLNADLSGIDSDSELIVAYEPIWSISTSGSGLESTPDEANSTIESIKEVLSKMGFDEIKVLYGGSVDGDDAHQYLKEDNIDGVLVGGASLRPDEFKQIVAYANE